MHFVAETLLVNILDIYAVVCLIAASASDSGQKNELKVNEAHYKLLKGEKNCQGCHQAAEKLWSSHNTSLPVES